MNKELEAIITKLAEKSVAAEKAGEAMQFAQAALNVAHALGTVEHARR